MNSNILIRMVAMRNGVKLHTVVYLPKGDDPYPVVLVSHPLFGERHASRARQG